MPGKARIKLSSTNLESLRTLENEILGVIKEANANFSGPIPLPTKVLKVVTQKNPSGEGTITWDKFEMRIHRRVFYVDASDKVLRSLLRVRLPEDVKVAIDLF
ncbi:MAG: 30S ribosomal protein S10 [Candidatus Brockarchaeota archaeon]|nr:30S ribosomal protein S10 [Candidatus Brockarchaeota archaeon]MBO3768335.1 30S ribosomal protein S10 [Candidatus Brockarchaeota archaeon]MBO3801673.1 30S ribosomal protein S10 [Candidatus Brockarchaeota archaeon]